MNRKREIPEIFESKTFLDPTYEPGFREVFKDADTIRDFLNSVLHLDGNREIDSLSFEYEDRIKFKMPSARSVVLDIHAWTKDHRCVDIEIQRCSHPFFVDRVLLYSFFLAIKGKQKMDKSPEFRLLPEYERKRRRYELPEVVSIWICNFHPLGEARDYREEWNLFSDYDLKKGDVLPVSRKMNYILFDLRSFTKKPEELNTREDQWLYLLSKAGGDDKLPEFDDDYVARAVERLRIENASDELIHAQEQKMMSQDEIDCRIGDGVARGVEQGIQQGIQQGIRQGIQQGENNALDVARSLGVSEEVLDQIRQKLAENKQ